MGFFLIPQPGSSGFDWSTLEGVVDLGSVSGATNLNLSANGGRRVFRGTLTGNAVLSPSNVPSSGLVTIVVLLAQDSNGDRTITFPVNTTLLSGSDGSVNPAANSVSVVTMMTSNGGSSWLAAISDSRPNQLDPFYINPLANGDIHVVFDFPVTLNLAAVRQRGTGSVAYARSTDGNTFNTVSGSVAFNANDVLRVTVTGYSGYLTLAIPRTA